MRKIQLHRIKQLADNIIHCGDYGQTYISEDLKTVTLVLGDADESDIDDLKIYVELCKMKFLIESETNPDGILISRGIIGEEDNSFDQDEYNIPESLSLVEYSEYLRLMKRLGD